MAKQETPTKAGTRESGMMVTTGMQGVGKTYLNMYIIRDYVKDKLEQKRKGRKCLILDTNGEYNAEQFADNGIPNFAPKLIAIKDVAAWCKLPGGECRRIDAKSLKLDEKKKIAEYILKIFRNGLVVLEDINNFLLDVSHEADIVGSLINLRHKATDVLISYQSLRPVEPRIFQNARWMRMHHQADNVMDIKAKLPNVALYKIAQILVDNRYFNTEAENGERFFVYIHPLKNKIEGAFSRNEFREACAKYVSLNKSLWREYMDANDCTMAEAKIAVTERYVNQYLLRR